MKNISTSVIILLIVVALNGAAIAGYYFFYQNLKQKNEHIAALTNEIDVMLKQETTRASLQNIVADTEADRKKLSTYFVSEEAIADFMAMIENMAKSRSVDFNVASINIKDIPSVTASTTHAFLDLRLETKGKWNDIMNFYSLLENLPYKTAFGSAQLIVDSRTVDPKTKVITTPRWVGQFDFSVVTIK